MLWIYGRICRHVSSKTLPALNFFQLTYNQNFNIIGLILVVIHHSPPKQVITSSDLNDYLLIHPESTGIAKFHLYRSFLIFASFLSLPYIPPFPYSYMFLSCIVFETQRNGKMQIFLRYVHLASHWRWAHWNVTKLFDMFLDYCRALIAQWWFQLFRHNTDVSHAVPDGQRT